MGLYGSSGLKSLFSLASLIGQDIVARSISLTQTAGNTAVQLVTGARLKLGGGTTDYLYSDGSVTVKTDGNIGVFGARLDCRSASFTNFSLGTAGNQYLGFVMPGTQAILTLVSGQSTSAAGVVHTVLNRNVTIVGSGADTTEDDLMTFQIPASVFTVDGMGVRMTAWGDGVNTADATTVRCYFGATAVVTKILTAGQANTWYATWTVFRTGAGAQVGSGVINNGGTANSAIQTNATPAETSVNAITVKCTGQRAVSSVANSVRQLGFMVEMIN